MRRAVALAVGLLGLAGGSAAAQFVVGAPAISPEVRAAFEKGRGGDRTELLRLAAAGRPDAQTYGGVLLAFAGDPSDAERAQGCAYLETASATRADAMHFRGEAAQYGRCTGKPDLEQAIGYFHKAGDMGLPKSRCAEGNVLIELGRDIQHAVDLCRQGAEAGDPDAQTDLGNFYLTGQNVTKDVAVARHWYEKAAAQNQANAALVLGQIYWKADGVPRDVDRAAGLWRIAYDHGREDAAAFLGDVAFLKARRGPDTWDPAGLAEARDWYAKAVDARNPDVAAQARERRDLSDQLIGVMRRKGVR